jgi:hypothetical protein
VNMLIRFWMPGRMIFMNWILSGPSVMAPKASRAEYLFFQSYYVMFCWTNLITGSITLFFSI